MRKQRKCFMLLLFFLNKPKLKNINMKKTISVSNQRAALDTGRRNFLKLSGVGIAMAGLVLVGCNDDDLIMDDISGNILI